MGFPEKSFMIFAASVWLGTQYFRVNGVVTIGNDPVGRPSYVKAVFLTAPVPPASSGAFDPLAQHIMPVEISMNVASRKIRFRSMLMTNLLAMGCTG